MRWHPARRSWIGRLVVRAEQSLIPIRNILRFRLVGVPDRPVVFTLVYRCRNADTVEALLRTLPLGSTVALWALDEIAPSLEKWTLGVGPGSRFRLHEELLRLSDAPSDVHWILSDDDIALRAAGIVDVVRTAQFAELDVYAPTHRWDSYWSYGYTCGRGMSLVRETAFVEVGPLVGFSPRARATLLPFPDVAGVGWGMEAHWSSVARPDLRNGLIDAVFVTHTMPVGLEYDQADEARKAQALLERIGVRRMTDLMRTSAHWRPWQSSPPWTRHRSRSAEQRPSGWS